MSTPAAAKSSKARLAASMMWRLMKGAPSAAPCSALLMQHSHSSTAQPSNPYWVSFEKMLRKVDLAVAERAKPSRAIDPRLKAAVHPHAPGGIELGVLDVKHLDAVVIEVDVGQVVELLQDEVAGIEQQVAARVIADPV